MNVSIIKNLTEGNIRTSGFGGEFPVKKDKNLLKSNIFKANKKSSAKRAEDFLYCSASCFAVMLPSIKLIAKPMTKVISANIHSPIEFGRPGNTA